MRYLTPPPMPSEKVLNAASVPRAMTRPFDRSRSVSSRSSMYPPASRLGSRRARMRSSPPIALVRADQAVHVAEVLVVVEVVHQAAGEPPQQAVKRIPHRQAHQRLEEQARQQARRRRPATRAARAARRRTPPTTSSSDARSRGKTDAAVRGCRMPHGDQRQQEERDDARQRHEQPDHRLHHPKLCCFIQLTLYAAGSSLIRPSR